MKLKNKTSRGITLIALVITIIILLILAGITIAELTGNGLFEKVKLAKEKSDNAQQLENDILIDYEEKINEIIGNREQTTIPSFDILYHHQSSSEYTHNYTITEENTKYKYLIIMAYADNISISSSPAYITITNDNIIPILDPHYMEHTEYGNMRISSDIYVGIINSPIKDDVISIKCYYSGQALVLGIK